MTADIAFVLVNFNGIADTVECVSSIQRCDSHAKIIIVDNGSENDEGDRIAKQWPEITTLKNAENRGWAGGNNTGIRRALGDGVEWICLLNNDTVVSDDFMKTHVESVKTFSDLRIYGPLINEYDEREKLQTASCFYNRKNHFGLLKDAEIEGDQKQIRCHDTDIVNGCCMLVHREVFESIGEIDEQFFLICEESDFCLRAKANGYQPRVIARTLVWHKHSVSFEKAGKPLQRYYLLRNLWRLI
ncbi:glycosyltransferase family 2 protein, partial [bacterium]|nr:glycosyltransferase family 2 protein [bacterium]